MIVVLIGWQACQARSLSTELTASWIVQQKNWPRLIKKLNKSFNSIHGLEGLFAQFNPDQTESKGRFWITRPCCIRFDYTSENMRVTTDGTWVVIVQDNAVPQRYPLTSLPLRFLFQKDVRIDREAILDNVQLNKKRKEISVTLHSKKNNTPGSIKIFVDSKNYSLRGWTVTDVQKLKTTVLLKDVASITPKPIGFFIVQDQVRPHISEGDHHKRS